MKLALRLALVITIFASLVFFGCAAAEDDTKGPITVGSKIDTEGSLLSQIIILMLEENGFEVIDRSGTGTTSVVRNAIMSGEIDIYPEYTGNGAFFFDETDSDVWNDPQKGFERVKELDEQENDIIWLNPAPANNTWAIAVTNDLSEEYGLKSLEDLAEYVNNGEYFKLIGSEEFVTSEVALPAFQEAYGFQLSSEQLIVVASGDTAQTQKAAYDGTDGVNAAMAYGTDGSISAFDLVILSDPKGAQPVYEPAPIKRKSVYEEYPEISQILEPVFDSLDLVTLQTLNGKIAVEGLNAQDVASEYLREEGFIQ